MKPLAVSMGDPAGIGLELAARVWSERGDAPPFILVGDPDAFERASARIGAPKPKLNIVDDPAQIAAPDGETLTVLHTPLAIEETPGEPDPVNADATIAAIEAGVAAVRAGAASALVTLPIAILQYLEWRIDPTIAAVSVLQILLIGGAMLVTDRFVKISRVV